MTSTKSVRTIVMMTLLSAMMIGMTACNTVKGVGKDTEKLGEKTQDAADSASK